MRDEDDDRPRRSLLAHDRDQLRGRLHVQTRGGLARQMREVRVEDVLGRDPVHMELERVGAYLGGATVLITGAGGSIGSELCRQIARVEPHRMILLDHAEDNLFSIQRELEDERHVPASMLAAVLADCREEERMREVFAEHRPTVVFHAAAYKHVGLMERNPVEAVRNNAIGTRVVATVAGQLGLDAFVLVSTDKAVMPATVMGASKALAECAIDAAGRHFPGTRYMAVRFGNVLGSSGSVVPIFRRQIAAGGPVTVTDPGMTRYFMTIPEAVALVIRAGALGSGGEVFVLDMGEPVSILDLATKMIELSGLRPQVDIAIETIGRAADITCPTWVCNAEGDDISASAPQLVDAMTCEKTYVHFTAAEGAGDHCEQGARALYHARSFAWLDELLHPGANSD